MTAAGRFGAYPRPVRGGAGSKALAADLAVLGTVAAVAGLFLISPVTLEAHGIAYLTSGGGVLSKFHPSTFVAIAALGLRCLATPRPLAYGWRLVTQDSGATILVAAFVIAAAYATTISHTPVTPLVDTFLLPVLVFLLLRDLDPAILRWLALLLVAILCANAVMAFIELKRGTHFISIDVPAGASSDPRRGDATFDWRAQLALDWRAVALLGHPLVNGQITGAFILCLCAPGTRWLPPLGKVPLLLLQAGAMFAFGARTALVVVVVFAGWLGVSQTVEAVVSGARLRPRQLALVLLATGLLIGIGLVLLDSGFFDQTLERFQDDQGSATARVTMFNLFQPIPWGDLLFAPDPYVVATWQRMEGLEFGIESSWIGLALTYGLILTAILVVGLIAFSRSLVRDAGRGTILVLASYFILVSVAASMSGKTTSFAMTTALILVFLQKDERPWAGWPPGRRRIGIAMAIRDIYGRHEELERAMASRRAYRDADRAPARATSLIEILWRRKLLVLATVVLCLFGGVLYIAITPSRYLASTSMLIDPRLGKSVGNDPVQPGFIPDTSAMDSQIKLFTSQTVLSRVATMANLKDDPEFNGSQRSLLQRILHPSAPLLDGVDLKKLEEAITIKRPERTYVVGIDVLARDADKAAEIANDITKAYVADQISSRVDAAQDDTSFVKSRLDDLSAQMKEAEDKVEAYKVENNIVDANGLRSNEQQVADLTKALGDARAKESSAKASMAEIDGMARGGHLDATSDALRSLTIERLRQQQAETDQNVAKLAMTLGPDHPELREARARQAEIRKLIRNELQRLKLAATGDYQEARRHEAQIVAEVDGLKAQSAKMSLALVPLEQLERRVRVLRSSFDRFAQVNDNLSQQEADSPPGRVIAVARPPVSPASPKKTIVGLVSLSAGLFFGLAAALFAESTSAERAPARAPLVFDEPRAPPPPPRPKPRTPRAPRRYWDDHDDDTHA